MKEFLEAAIIPIDHLTSMLDKNLKPGPKYRKSKTGRPSCSSSILLSMVILESHYNFSDQQTEYQYKYRVDFR